MTAFIIAAVLLTVFILALIARPLLWRGKAVSHPSMERLNTGILHDEIVALERDHANGKLSESDLIVARDEVHRRLLEEAANDAPVSRKASRPRLTLIPLALMLPVVAAALYLTLGSPAALNGPPPAPANLAAPDVQKMVATLAAKLEAQPDNPVGWAMLGRSYTVMGRYPEAAAAYGRIGPSLEQNPDWLAQYADALAMAAGGKLSGKPQALIEQALAVAPDHVLALMLGGAAALERGDFKTALQHYQRARPLVQPDSEDARYLDDAIGKTLAQLGEPGAAPQVQATPAGATAKTEAKSGAISVSISVAPALQGEVANKTLFLIARAPGERMPLAVVVKKGLGFPATVVIDDSASMVPTRLLSSAPALEIEGRISATGIAGAASGDLFGVVKIPHPPVAAIAVTIDQRRP